MDFFAVLDLFFLRGNFFSNSVFKSSKQIGLDLFCISCTLPQRGSRKKAFRIPIWDATVAKLVDAIGLGPIGRNAVLVRVQSVAPSLRPIPSVLRSAHAGALSLSSLSPLHFFYRHQKQSSWWVKGCCTCGWFERIPFLSLWRIFQAFFTHSSIEPSRFF